jgi:hypothetical protein
MRAFAGSSGPVNIHCGRVLQGMRVCAAGRGAEKRPAQIAGPDRRLWRMSTRRCRPGLGRRLSRAARAKGGGAVQGSESRRPTGRRWRGQAAHLRLGRDSRGWRKRRAREREMEGKGERGRGRGREGGREKGGLT